MAHVVTRAMKLCAGCPELVPAGTTHCPACARLKPRSPSGHATRTAEHRHLRPQVLARDGFRCQCTGCAVCTPGGCGAAVTLHGDMAGHADHVVPVVDGGETTLANLVTKCRRCNLSKGARS